MKILLSILQLNEGFGKRENNRIPASPIQIPQWASRFRWKGVTLSSAVWEEHSPGMFTGEKFFASSPILSLDKL